MFNWRKRCKKQKCCGEFSFSPRNKILDKPVSCRKPAPSAPANVLMQQKRNQPKSSPPRSNRPHVFRHRCACTWQRSLPSPALQQRVRWPQLALLPPNLAKASRPWAGNAPGALSPYSGVQDWSRDGAASWRLDLKAAVRPRCSEGWAMGVFLPMTIL